MTARESTLLELDLPLLGEITCRRCGGFQIVRNRSAAGGEYVHCPDCRGTGAETLVVPPQIACGDLPDPSGQLAWVIADPGENTHRLRYADWLMENGQEARGEYIQTFSALTGDVPPEQALDRSTRNNDLWFRTIGKPHEHLMAGVMMDRGFIGAIKCNWSAWGTHGPALRACEWAPRVKLSDWPRWNCDDRGSDEFDTWLLPEDATESGREHRVGVVLRQRWSGSPLAFRDENRRMVLALLHRSYPGTLFEIP